MFVTFPVHHLVSIRFPLGYSPFSACPYLSPSSCSIRFPLLGKKSCLRPWYLTTHSSTPHTKNYFLHSLHSLHSLSLSLPLSPSLPLRSCPLVPETWSPICFGTFLAGCPRNTGMWSDSPTTAPRFRPPTTTQHRILNRPAGVGKWWGTRTNEGVG